MTDDLLHDLLTAERGSRELDARFDLALLPTYLKTKDADGYVQVNRKGTVMTPVWEDYDPTSAPHYTTNMQDTIEAVPEEYLFGVESLGGAQPNIEAWVNCGDGDSYAVASTAPLALSAAILKAKGAQDGS